MQLENSRHELFAQALIKHKGNQTRAYMEIYPNSSSARFCASRLLANVVIQRRVSELLEAHGLGVPVLIKTLKKLTNAKKIIPLRNGWHRVADSSVILEVIKTLLRLHGLLGDKSDQVGVFFSQEQLAQLAKEQELLRSEEAGNS